MRKIRRNRNAITYLGQNDRGYTLGTTEHYEVAIRQLKNEDCHEMYLFHGNVECLIRDIGITKIFNLVRIVHNATGGGDHYL